MPIVLGGSNGNRAFVHPLQSARCKSDYFSNIIRTVIFARILFLANPLTQPRRNKRHRRCGFLVTHAACRARKQVSQTIGVKEHGAEDQSIIWCGLSRSSVGGLRGKRFILPQKLFNLFAGDAGAKQVSLHFITFQRPQKRGLLMGFHSLSDHLQM
jgi:hypothetical protein